MIIVVRFRRRDTSHLVSYINLQDHISSPLIAFKSTRIPINFTGAFFNNISACVHERGLFIYGESFVRRRSRPVLVSVSMHARTHVCMHLVRLSEGFDISKGMVKLFRPTPPPNPIRTFCLEPQIPRFP